MPKPTIGLHYPKLDPAPHSVTTYRLIKDRFVAFGIANDKTLVSVVGALKLPSGTVVHGHVLRQPFSTSYRPNPNRFEHTGVGAPARTDTPQGRAVASGLWAIRFDLAGQTLGATQQLHVVAFKYDAATQIYTQADQAKQGVRPEVRSTNPRPNDRTRGFVQVEYPTAADAAQCKDGFCAYGEYGDGDITITDAEVSLGTMFYPADAIDPQAGFWTAIFPTLPVTGTAVVNCNVIAVGNTGTTNVQQNVKIDPNC